MNTLAHDIISFCALIRTVSCSPDEPRASNPLTDYPQLPCSRRQLPLPHVIVGFVYKTYILHVYPIYSSSYIALFRSMHSWSLDGYEEQSAAHSLGSGIGRHS